MMWLSQSIHRTLITLRIISMASLCNQLCNASGHKYHMQSLWRSWRSLKIWRHLNFQFQGAVLENRRGPSLMALTT